LSFSTYNFKCAARSLLRRWGHFRTVKRLKRPDSRRPAMQDPLTLRNILKQSAKAVSMKKNEKPHLVSRSNPPNTHCYGTGLAWPSEHAFRLATTDSSRATVCPAPPNFNGWLKRSAEQTLKQKNPVIFFVLSLSCISHASVFRHSLVMLHTLNSLRSMKYVQNLGVIKFLL